MCVLGKNYGGPDLGDVNSGYDHAHRPVQLADPDTNSFE